MEFLYIESKELAALGTQNIVVSWNEANRLYYDMLEEESDGLYIRDIIRGGIGNDDPRIPGNLSE